MWKQLLSITGSGMAEELTKKLTRDSFDLMESSNSRLNVCGVVNPNLSHPISQLQP